VIYVWRQLLARKVRTLLCLLGVAVSVAMIVSILSLSLGMRRSLNRYMEASGASLIVFDRSAADLAFSRVSPEEIARLQALPGVIEIARANFTAVFAPELGERERPTGFSVIFVFGRFFDERMVEKYEEHLVGGRMPAQPSEILLGRLVAARLGIEVGERFPLFREEILGITEYEVVGIFETELSWENLGVVADARVVQEKVGGGEQYALVFVYTHGDDVERVRDAIENTLPGLIATRAGEFTDRFSDQMAYIDEFILVLQLIAATVGILGVLNTMMMSVTERVREIGTLRAIGWSRRRVVGVVVGEGLLISGLGGALGLGLGVAGTEAVIAFVSDGLLIAAYVLETFVQGSLLALVVGLVGSLYPALRASRLRPAEALRHE